MDLPSFVPDLLHATPLSRVDLQRTRQAVGFAFASGVSGGLFQDALERAKVAPSTWQPEFFASDLFLQGFVTRCFRISVGEGGGPVSTAHLVNLLAHPPRERDTIDFRRAILSELRSSPELRREMERLYTLLCRFRAVLEGAAEGRRWDANRRRLDILQAAKDVIDCLAEGFTGATSGLTRLTEFGRRVREGEPYHSLSDLLSFDENLATVSLRVGVGADGTIRGFRVLSVESNERNPFVTSAWRRWLVKLELYARGFRFGDYEVMARLVDAVFDGLHDEVVRFVQLLGDVEFHLGALGFMDVAKAAGLSVCMPDFVGPDAPRSLSGLFNPLLLQIGPEVVPCDLNVDRHTATTLVTGPNSGGKTRLLQAVGLVQLLGQSGVFVPARSATVALCPSLVMSLIQDTKADQTEGRLGMELLRIRALFEKLPPGAMVILDELCSGTNPSEGEEIFELVVSILSRLDPQVFITTHFLAFASRLEQDAKIPRLRFLQVELGPDQQPTYQFVPGVARTSLAGQAAARLGVTADQLLGLVERNIARAGSGS